MLPSCLAQGWGSQETHRSRSPPPLKKLVLVGDRTIPHFQVCVMCGVEGNRQRVPGQSGGGGAARY